MVREETRHAGTALSTGIFIMQSDKDAEFYQRVFPPPSGPNYRWEGRKLIVDPRAIAEAQAQRKSAAAGTDPEEAMRQELSGLSDADLDVMRQEAGLKRQGGEAREKLIARLAAHKVKA